MRWVGYVVHKTEKRNTDRVLVGKSEGKRSLGKPRHTVEHNVKMNSNDIGWEDQDWINTALVHGTSGRPLWTWW